MKIKLLDTNGITLKTKDKLCTEDIEIVVDESVGGSGSGESTLKKLLDGTKSCYYMFNKYTGTSVSSLISYNDTENVTNMSHMFHGCFALTTIPQLDTSKVTNMSYMLNNCALLTTIPQLDTSKVTNISYMFYGCASLTTIPQLDTSKVTNMGNMFFECSKLTTIDITHYKISSTSSSSYWYYNCYSLKTIIIRSFGTSYALNSNSFTNCYHLTGTVNATYNPTGAKDGYIYVPRSMVSKLSSATNWATYASQLRALEDYTVDGTTTGELDESKVNA